MHDIDTLLIDDIPVSPISVQTYSESLKIELPLDEVDKVFPYKPETPRYKVTGDDIPMGYYKILSARPQANQQTTTLSLHRQ